MSTTSRGATVRLVSDMQMNGYLDGQTSPDEIYGRLYPSTDLYGVGGEGEAVSTVTSIDSGQDQDPDDL